MFTHVDSAPFVKDSCLQPEIYRIAYSQGSDLQEPIHTETKSYRTENNICLVGGLQERHDLICVDRCKNKDSNAKKLAATNHAPSAPLTWPLKVPCRNLSDSSGFFQVSATLTHQFSTVQSSCSVVSDSLRPHESQHTRPPCPSPTPGVHPNSCASSWCIALQ